jgi:glyceraldehyde-3-phosphate dehydrogenase/erythrose-4-phosphate dehydrogenase
VPVRTGTIAELNLVTERPVTVNEVNDAFRKAAETAPLKDILGVLEDEWASSRILGDPHSPIVDLPLTAVQEGTLLSVAAWYDNERALRRAWPRWQRVSPRRQPPTRAGASQQTSGVYPAVRDAPAH